MERALNQVVEDALSEVLDLACQLSKHRGSRTLGRNDVRVAFEKRLKVRVPYKAPTALMANTPHSTQIPSLAATALASAARGGITSTTAL